MSPSVLEIVAAFEAEQREKNAAAAKVVADYEAKCKTQIEACEAALVEIINEFKPVLDRAFTGLDTFYRHPGGVRRYFNLEGLRFGTELVVRVQRYDRDGLLRYELGDGWDGYHEQYVRKSFITTDPTEFKVKLAQKLGVMLANTK